MRLLLILLTFVFVYPSIVKGNDWHSEESKRILDELFTRVDKVRESEVVTNAKNLDSLLDHETENKDTLLVFISLSMPEKLIKEYIQEASKYNAVLVLRGLVDNSLRKTVKKLMEIEGIFNNGLPSDANFKERQLSKMSIIIHPHLFDLYDIKVVPTIVLSKRGYPCMMKYDDCNSSYLHDKISGSITIEYALEQFRDGGSVELQEVAGFLLERVKNDKIANKSIKQSKYDI